MSSTVHPSRPSRPGSSLALVPSSCQSPGPLLFPPPLPWSLSHPHSQHSPCRPPIWPLDANLAMCLSSFSGLTAHDAKGLQELVPGDLPSLAFHLIPVLHSISPTALRRCQTLAHSPLCKLLLSWNPPWVPTPPFLETLGCHLPPPPDCELLKGSNCAPSTVSTSSRAWHRAGPASPASGPSTH